MPLSGSLCDLLIERECKDNNKTLFFQIFLKKNAKNLVFANPMYQFTARRLARVIFCQAKFPLLV